MIKEILDICSRQRYTLFDKTNKGRVFINMEVSSSDIAGMIFSIVFIGIVVVYFLCIIVGTWKVFGKVGKPRWAAIVPGIRSYELCRIGFGAQSWLFLLLFIPFINFVVNIMLGVKMAEIFGKGVLFGLGLAFIPGVFYIILGFGSSEYHRPEPI